MAKQKEIIVKDTTIRTMSQNGFDYICITDIARQKNALEPNVVIGNWMRNRNTIEYLGLWEILNNPNFNPIEFEGFRNQAGLNAFTLSPARWIEATNAIGLISTAGRYGGTFAQRDMAFKFASWVSVEFELYLIKEFQRLKEEEQKALGWSAKRELAKINYHIHTDAIKEHLIPEEIDPYHRSLIYANEADVLNVALFGITENLKSVTYNMEDWQQMSDEELLRKTNPDIFSIVKAIGKDIVPRCQIIPDMGLKGRRSWRIHHFNPAREDGFVEMTKNHCGSFFL